MKRAAAISAVLAILGLGVLVGVLGTHLFYAQKLRRPGSFSSMASQLFAERLDRELSLSAEQRDAIAAILEETQLEADSLRDEVRPRVGALMDDASERISEVLTPEQRRRFVQLRKEHRSRAEHFLLGPPGHHGPPGWRGHRHPAWRGRPPGDPLEERPPGGPLEERPPEERPPAEPDSRL